MATKQYYFTFKGLWKRMKQEYSYYTKRPWSLTEVGDFWNTVEDYDDINEQLYPYFRRFTNSYHLAEKYLPENNYKMLDIQARSGKASLFWHQKGKIDSSICVDFSDYLLSLADRRLRGMNLNYSNIKVTQFPLPFIDKHFDFISCYETIEHVYDYDTFCSELSRILQKDKILIITCPNRAWEWVHWLTAIININHSEGPHRFIKRKKLLKTFKKYNLDVLEENTTIILPFNKPLSVKMDKFLEKQLPEWIKKYIALRRTFILKKI